MFKEVKTDELILRRFKEDDADKLYSNHKDPEVMKWIPNESYEDRNEARDAAAFFSDCTDKEQLPFVLAIEHEGELIGDVGINEVEGCPGEVEAGYTVISKYKGRGYATKALMSMAKLASSMFGVNTLYGRVMKGNDASVRVLEKNGFVFVKEEMNAEDDPYGNGMLVYKKVL